MFFLAFELKNEFIFLDGKCYKPVNLAIIIDASGSIEPSDWSAEISAAKSIVETIAKASTENKFAIIEFSTDATVSFTSIYHQGAPHSTP